MHTREIPPARWRDFFDSFSKQHQDWVATVTIVNQGDQSVEARDLPLVGLSADGKGSEPDAVAVELGRDPSDHITHMAENAQRVLFHQTEDESDLTLEIESTSGEKTVVHLRRATREELAGRGRKERTRPATG